VAQGTANSAANAWPVSPVLAGSAVSSSNPLPMTFGAGVTLPGFASTPTVNIGTSPTIAVTGTFYQATQPVSLASLPALATGANTIGGVTQSGGPWSVSWSGQSVGVSSLPALPSGANVIGSVSNAAFGAAASPVTTNPTSTLTLTSATTAYTAGQLIANNATAGSVVVPSFAIANSAGGALIPRLRLSTNDSTSTAWGAQTVQIDLWLAAPTFTNGDRAAWSIATGTGNHLGAFTCLMSAEYGDGAYAECSPAVGNGVMPKLASGTAVYWTAKATTGSGLTGASKVFTLTAEELN
jgi:hypothetical protein